MFNLKKSSFTFLILLISFSSVFARGKQDIIEEDSHVIDTYQVISKENQNEEIEIVEITVEPNENETSEIKLDVPVETNEEKNESEIQPDISEDDFEETIQTDIIEDIELEINETKNEDEIIEVEKEEVIEDDSVGFDFSSENVLEINKREYIFDFAPKKEQKLPKSIKQQTKKFIKNPDECDKNGKTLLMQAIQTEDIEQIELLLESKANVNLQDNEGWTALMYCVRYQNNVDLLKTLLNYGANYQLKTNFGLSLLDLCVSYCDDLDVIKTTLSLYEKTSNEVLKSFSLLLSSSFYDEDLFLKKIQLFLNYKINLNSLHNGKTPLMYLCQNNSSTKAIQLLLKNGANNKIKSSENKTAFDYASENKSLQKDDIYWSLN